GRLCRHHHGRQDCRADGAVRNDDGVVPSRAHGPGARSRGGHVRDHGLVHARRACQRRLVRPHAGAGDVSAHRGAQPPPVSHQRRLHRRADLQRQALERVHESRSATVGQRAVFDVGTARPRDRHGLRTGGRDDEGAVHRRVVGAAPRTRDTGRTTEHAGRAFRRSTSQRRRLVRDGGQPVRAGALPRCTHLVLADTRTRRGPGAGAWRRHRRRPRRAGAGCGHESDRGFGIALNQRNRLQAKELPIMAVLVYKRILDLFEAEGVNTLFGIPDPNFVHMFAEADARGWSGGAPHHELSAGFMAEAASRMTGGPGLCIGTLGPGMANIAGAIQCAKVENSPVIFLGGQRARITERRVRRGRIQFVRQEPLVAPSVKYSASIEYADQTDEVIHEAIRRAMAGTPGPAYIEYPSHVILEELDVPDPLPPNRYRLVNHTAGEGEGAEGGKLIRASESPILLVGHGVHPSRTGAAVRGLADLMQCPVIQTSGGTSFIDGLEDRTFAYGFSPAAVEAVVKSDLCVALGTELGEPSHYGKTRHWAQNDAKRKWVLIEQDPGAIGVNRPIDIPL